ncbi:MAG: hypothetical protein LBC57_03575 [Treponema sp.]|nr:hypothetical protein [Treponema sp.]
MAADGDEHEGRIFYEKGIFGVAEAFQEAQTSADPQTMILAELAFLQQELQFCDETDADTKNSLTQAIQSFEDALRCLKTVEDTIGYRFAETTHPTASKYRIQGFPKDAFHLACIAHRTRLRNSLRTPGINMREKAVLYQRAANMTTAQGSYIEKQKKVLA